MEYRSTMRWTNRILVLLGVVLTSGGLQAVPAAELKDNYQSIIERNPFGLKPPPPPPTNNLADLKEKPKLQIFLTGMTAVDYPRLEKQAYFYTVEQGKKEPPTYYALNEGDGKDGIQVLSIDAQGRKVRVKMDNKETLLSFETHGVPAAAAPVAGRGVPAIPAPGQVTTFRPGRTTAFPSPNGAPRATRAANGQPVNQNGGASDLTRRSGRNTTTGLRQIPSRRIRAGNPSVNAGTPRLDVPGNQQLQGEPEPSLAEQYLRMHLSRTAQEQKGIPMPPIPTLQ